jgi:hypothetical protein
VSTVLRADSELLARIARLNQALVACALPLANHTLTPKQLRALADELDAVGDELHAVSRELRDRVGPTCIDAPIKFTDDVGVLAIENPQRTAHDRWGQPDPAAAHSEAIPVSGGKE